MIMDYEKLYKEALERATKAKNNASLSNGTLRVLGIIFPELKEPDDERIRKELKRAIAVALDYSYFDKVTADNCLAWLEKQGEQKPAISDDALKEGIVHFGITQYQIDNWLKKYIGVEERR